MPKMMIVFHIFISLSTGKPMNWPDSCDEMDIRQCVFTETSSKRNGIGSSTSSRRAPPPSSWPPTWLPEVNLLQFHFTKNIVKIYILIWRKILTNLVESKNGKIKKKILFVGQFSRNTASIFHEISKNILIWRTFFDFFRSWRWWCQVCC